MNILVTGATGFIGTNLVSALLKHNAGFKINVLVRKSSSIDHLKNLGSVNILYGDITDIHSLKDCVKGADIVFHLAGILGRWDLSDKLYWDVHVNGTHNLIKTCLARGAIGRFIYLSSAGVLGPGVKEANEAFPLNPSNVYEKAKAEAERMVFYYYKKNKLPITIMRPEFVYGPKDTHVLALFKAIKQRIFILINGGNSYLHPTYIEDLNKALLSCMFDKKSIGELYIIAGERSITVKEFAILIAKYLKVGNPNILVSQKTALLGSSMLGLAANLFKFDPILTESRVKFFSENRSYDISKAKKNLGFKPSSLEDGIKNTIDWYKSNGYL